MAVSLLIFASLWLATAVVVLALARLLGRLSAPSVHDPVQDAPADAPIDNVVALVPRGRNDLVSAGESRRAA